MEDESPVTNTTEEDGSPPAANVGNGALPNPSEDSKDDTPEPAARRPGGIFATMAEIREQLTRSGQSAEAAKKFKKATAEKTAQRLKKRPTWALPPEVPPQVDPTVGASVNDGNDPPTEGTQANAVTPARPPK